MNKTLYSDSFKRNAVSKLLMPGSPGIIRTAAKMGIPISTLFSWKKKYGNITDMKREKQNPNKWTPEQKLETLNKTATLSEYELGEYLRSNGLHSSDLERFKNEFLIACKSKGRPSIDPEVSKLKKENSELERALKRSQTALAEQSARIILLKKSHEIWGELEGDE